MSALRTLWITLPLRAVTDEQGTLDAYGFALEPFSIEAIGNTVNMLRRGEIKEASKEWCPKPPQLAEYVRSEQARLDAINRPKAIPYQPPPRDYLVHQIKQRRDADELAKKGFYCLAKEVDHIMSINMWKTQKRSVWSVWFASLQEVWEPPHV